MTKTIKPEWMNAERLHNERWEDEGGTIAEIAAPVSTGRFVRPMPKTGGIPGTPKQWNRQFIIEPFPAATDLATPKEMLQTKRNAS